MNQDTVTGADVGELRREAAEAGDAAMVELCDRALEPCAHGCCASGDCEAWEECERVILAARAVR